MELIYFKMTNYQFMGKNIIWGWGGGGGVYDDIGLSERVDGTIRRTK